ncbi:ankyrin repeat-containing domain protein [Chytriomyces sp. MP71]|nr:ankyrin repeat-containing domain protein [Chytriomyces sp. MP71]
MHTLPHELVEQILSHLHPHEVFRLRRQCLRRWRDQSICCSVAFAVVNIRRSGFASLPNTDTFDNELNWLALGVEYMAALVHLSGGFGFDVQRILLGPSMETTTLWLTSDAVSDSELLDFMAESEEDVGPLGEDRERSIDVELAITKTETSLFIANTIAPLDWTFESYYVLRWAACAGAEVLAEFLLTNALREDDEFEFRSAVGQALQLSSACGRESIVSLILDCARSTPGLCPLLAFEGALHYASSNNHHGIADLLIKFIDTCSHFEAYPINYTSLLTTACKRGNVATVRLFLSPTDDPAGNPRKGLDVTQSVTSAISRGHVEILQLLIESYSSAKTHVTLLPAVKGNHINMVRHILYSIPTIAFSDRDVWSSFIECCEQGQLDIATLLLLPSPAPSASYTCLQSFSNPELFLQKACESNHPDLVELLLVHMDIDASHENNRALRHAASNGYTRVVELLLDLQGSAVDPGALNNMALRNAAERGHTEVVARLLKDGRIDVGAQENAALRLSCEYGHMPIVKMLLQVEGVDPGANTSYGLRAAARNRHLEVVQLLLKDGRSDVGARDGYVMKQLEAMGDSVWDLLP